MSRIENLVSNTILTDDDLLSYISIDDEYVFLAIDDSQVPIILSGMEPGDYGIYLFDMDGAPGLVFALDGEVPSIPAQLYIAEDGLSCSLSGVSSRACEDIECDGVYITIEHDRCAFSNDDFRTYNILIPEGGDPLTSFAVWIS